MKFSVDNFRSISTPCEINFLPSKDSSHSNIVREKDGLEVLPSVVIYGANGAGKTNIAKAIFFATYIIKNSIKIHEGDPIPYNPFKLKIADHTRPTSFKFLFIVDNQRYYYGFSFTAERIVEEFLYSYPNGRQTTIFERTNCEYNFKSDKKELELLSKRTLKNRLFLATASEWNYDRIKTPFRYLKDHIVINANFEKNYNWLEYTIQKVEKDPQFKKVLISILRELGTDIVDLKGKVHKSEKREFGENSRPPLSELKILRKGFDSEGRAVGLSFDLMEESKGTQKLIELIGPWIDIMEQGKLIVVDELDTSLHPLISRYLIGLFHSRSSNSKDSQLLFTTHDTNLLDLEFFRRDQIYFAEKRGIGETDLYSLSDIKSVRKDENVRKGYIRGKYGAIPFLNSLDSGGSDG